MEYLYVYTYQDINECTTGASDCDPNADCKDKVGSYECHCKTGYKGDGKTCTGNWYFVITVIFVVV